MKKFLQRGLLPVLTVMGLLLFGTTVRAQEDDVIKDGIYIGNVNVSGMTREEAEETVANYVEALGKLELTLMAAQNKEVVVKVEELGIFWENSEVIQEALEMGSTGNVIERYKIIKDLEHDNLEYPLELGFDAQAISDVLTAKCAVYDVARVDSSLELVDGEFVITEGHTGYSVDVETSIDKINDYLKEWDYQSAEIALDIVEDVHRGTLEELQQVKDVLGTFTTSYKTSGTSRSANVKNGTELINGVLLYPGDEFSALAEVTPFTEANGYYPAGSYLNGQVVDSLGGGICQVTTTLYNAVLLAELEISQRFNHSMTVSYVPLAMDAAIAESAGKDFKFVNNTDAPVYIEGYIKNKTVTFNIYGKETRDEGREISFETEVRETISPSPDIITADAGRAIGYVSSSSGYTGYKTTLWKIVKENGVQISRTQVNTSNYKMVQRTAVVGVATEDEWARNEIMAAIGTANIDHVRNVIAIITAPPVEEDYEEE